MRRTLLFPVFLIFLSVGIASGQNKYTATEAINHIGEYATVTGRVYQVYESRKGTIFLDIGGEYPNDPFSAVIFSRDAPKFKNIRDYQDSTVGVTGKIKEYEGNAEIILNQPVQIRIVN